MICSFVAVFLGIFGSCITNYSIAFPNAKIAAKIVEKFLPAEFESKVNSENEIWTAYIVTDFEKGFKSMTKSLNVKKSYQLYRDYLDNFRINTERN